MRRVLKVIRENRLESFLVLGIITLSAFLRFYNLSHSFVFTIDEEYHVLLAQSILQHPHIKLIGVSVSVGFYLGSLWTYLTAALLLLSKNNPIGLGYFSSLVGVITTFLVYWTGKKLFGTLTALIGSVLYATLPLIVYYDQKYWNDTPVPFLSLIMLVSLSLSKQSSKCWVLFALAVGLMFHTHLSLFPYLFIAAYIFIKQFKDIPKRIIIYSTLVLLIFLSPLIVFDMTHQWTNLKAPLQFLKSDTKNNEGLNLTKHSLVLWQSLGRFWYLNPGSSNADESNWGCSSISMNFISKEVDKVTTRTNPLIFVSAITPLLLLVLIFKRKTWQDRNRKILLIAIVIFLNLFLIFPGGALEYYLLGIFPLLVFLPGLVIEKTKGLPKALLIISVGVIIALGILTVIHNNTQFGMSVRRNLISKVMFIVGSNTYELNQAGGCQEYAGWRYLFSAYGKEPSRSYTDKFLGWIYPDKLSTKPVEYTVTVVEKRMFNQVIDQAKIIDSGGFRAYVVKNN